MLLEKTLHSTHKSGNDSIRFLDEEIDFVLHFARMTLSSITAYRLVQIQIQSIQYKVYMTATLNKTKLTDEFFKGTSRLCAITTDL